MLEKIIEWWGNLNNAERIAIIVPVGIFIIGGIAKEIWDRAKKRGGDCPGEITVDDSQKIEHVKAKTVTTIQGSSLDRSRREAGGVYIENIEKGANVVINVPPATPVDYQDGVRESAVPEVRQLFEAGWGHVTKREFREAIGVFESCLGLEKDSEKRGAINIQLGNCYYYLRRYVEAAEIYGDGLKEAQKANDKEGQGSALLGIGNTFYLRPSDDGAKRDENIREAVGYYNKALKFFTKDEYRAQYAGTQNNLGLAYTDLPSATSEERTENVRRAIECYKAALEIYKKDEYPVDYAMTQNNLGTAYTDLPSATAEERAGNVRRAIACYEAALEITRKDEYPHYYCETAMNLGMVLVNIDKAKACYWLKEAYSLREFLPDQGKRLEGIIERVCE